MSFLTIDALRESLAHPIGKVRTPEYIAKMMHPVPESTVVDRAAFIIERCKGQRVLEFGASGWLHDKIRQIAAAYLGVDRQDASGVVGFDLDDVEQDALPDVNPFPTIVVCGEVLEHLTNPGWFLQRLRAQYLVPVLITVPNAFSSAAAKHIKDDGNENVNVDHVAWYSYRTLRTLLERYGYVIEEFYWYQGQPFTAEGMIVVAR